MDPCGGGSSPPTPVGVMERRRKKEEKRMLKGRGSRRCVEVLRKEMSIRRRGVSRIRLRERIRRGEEIGIS